MKLPKKPLWTTLMVAVCIVLAGCTIVREVDNGDNGDNGDAGVNDDTELIFNDIPIDADIVDGIIFVDLSRSSTGIMNGYHSYIHQVELALNAQGVFMRDLAVAPLYRQQSHRPPLLYGRGDDNNLRPSLEETLLYYMSDDGRAHLGNQVEAPGENPAVLGMNLDQEPVFNPETGTGDGRSYFRQPEDGFVVFHITGGPRSCGHSHADCAIDGQSPADYFTDSDGEQASWLNLPGSGLAPDDIIHVSIATDEGVDFDTFSGDCTSRPDFPTSYLDFLEPSQHQYFGPFGDELENHGGASRDVDMCNALSSELDGSALRTANAIADVAR